MFFFIIILALKCSNSKPLVEALCLLEYVLKNSPSNFHCKLLCIKFYHILGLYIVVEVC